MNITIRKTEPKDYPAVLELIKELALFERAPEKVTNTVELMQEENHYFQSLVAEKEDGEIVGMAIYFFAYYTWVGKSLYLDDIVVKEKYRGNKIGTKLLDKVIEFGNENNCKRIRWQVLDWNTDAIEFYKKYGARLDGEWVNCDIE
ncbi:MAG: N-acetyltransferase family protein [Deltaproteobacteria bacterium]